MDPDVKARRRLAATVEAMVPHVDVLLYAQSQEALTGIVTHRPDVTFVAERIGDVDGPSFLSSAMGANADPKYVGLVDHPSPESSVRWVEAGAKVVVAKPVDRMGVRAALRHTDGGIDP